MSGSVTVSLALIVDPSLTSVSAIATVAATFIVHKLIAPTLPEIYRATRPARTSWQPEGRRGPAIRPPARHLARTGGGPG